MHIIFRIILYASWISISLYAIYDKYNENIQFEKFGLITKAEIIDFTRSEDDDGDVSYYPVLEFRDSSKNIIEFGSSVSDSDYKIGDSLEITYLKHKPRQAIVNSFSSFYNGIIGAAIFGAMGILFMTIDFSISILKWRKKRKSEKQYLESKQIKVYGKIMANEKINTNKPHSPKSN